MNAAFDSGNDICADFLVEAREILDQLGEQMVALESSPADRECLNAVFRGFHTIKGGAGFLDFPPMVAICHAVEDRLNVARSGETPLDAAAFDGAQQSLDLLVDMLDCVAAGEPLTPAPQHLLDAMRVGAPVGAATATATAPADDNLDDFDIDALLDSLHGAGAAPSAIPDPAHVAVRPDVAHQLQLPAPPHRPRAGHCAAHRPQREGVQPLHTDVRVRSAPRVPDRRDDDRVDPRDRR